MVSLNFFTKNPSAAHGKLRDTIKEEPAAASQGILGTSCVVEYPRVDPIPLPAPALALLAPGGSRVLCPAERSHTELGRPSDPECCRTELGCPGDPERGRTEEGREKGGWMTRDGGGKDGGGKDRGGRDRGERNEGREG